MIIDNESNRREREENEKIEFGFCQSEETDLLVDNDNNNRARLVNVTRGAAKHARHTKKTGTNCDLERTEISSTMKIFKN